MYGGAGDDYYFHNANGNSYVWEDTSGSGGIDDRIIFSNVTYDQIGLYHVGNDLVAATYADAADGVYTNAVFIKDYYLYANTIEYIVDYNGMGWAV